MEATAKLFGTKPLWRCYNCNAPLSNFEIKSLETVLTKLCFECQNKFSAGARFKKSEDVEEMASKPDLVNHPPHYTSHPSGLECIEITRHMTFNLGNAIKYIWRAGLKSSDPILDLEKSIWYLRDEIKRLKKEPSR